MVIVTVMAATHPATRVHHVAEIEGVTYRVIREGYSHEASGGQGG